MVGILPTKKKSAKATEIIGKKESTVSVVKKFMSAKSDIIFKLLFGDELNKDILITFLMAVLQLPLEEFFEIKITDPHSKRKYKGDKLAILDVKVTTATGKIINIEIQVKIAPEMRERLVFYNARIMSAQLGESDDYTAVKKVISIIIAGEKLLPEHDVYHDKFTLYSTKTNTEFTDVIEIHTLELSKLPKKSDGTALYDWLEFINADSEEELNMLAQKSPQMKAPVRKLLDLNQDENARALYEAREKQRRDNMARENQAKKEGISEVARNLLEMNMSVSDIAKATGFTAKEIENL